MTSGNSAFYCVSCGSRQFSKVRKYVLATDFFRDVLSDLYIYRCEACRLCQVNHAAIDQKSLAGLYKDFYRVTKPLNPHQLHNKYTVRAWIFRDLIKKYYQGAPLRIYEPGCGFGHSLVYFKRHFPACEVFTYELDTRSVGDDFKVFNPTVDSGKFDVILMSHLLEHIVCPKEYVSNLIEHLNAGGLLVIEVPNDNSYFLSKKFIVEPHVTFFDQSTLTGFFQNFRSLLEIKTCFTARGTDVLEPKNDSVAVMKYYAKKVLRRILELSPSIKTRLMQRCRGKLAPAGKDEVVDISLMKERYRTYSQPVDENKGWGLRMVLQKKIC